jgi:hypothetical protein
MHDHKNFSHPLINHTITNLNVNIEEHVANEIEEDVEVLEAPCGNKVWLIERCPLRRMFNVSFCKNPPNIFMLQG